MPFESNRLAVFGVICIGWCGGLALAQPASDSALTDSERIARLEAVVASQQADLAGWKARAEAADDKNLDAARTEALKTQIRAILGEREFRESLLPSVMTAGYDGGFFIRSADDKFALRFNGLIQFRWTYYNAQHENVYVPARLPRDDRSGFDINRLRLRFSGNAYSPDLTYAVELETDSPDGYNTVLSEAWFNYRFADELQFKAGYIRPASTRMQFMDNGNMQFVDRSMVDAVFGFGYAVGARVWGLLFNKRLEYYIDVVNSLADSEVGAIGRTITPDPSELDGNPALVARLVWHALGEKPGEDFAADADMPSHGAPALDFGFHYAFNDDYRDRATTRIPVPRIQPFGTKGGFALVSTNGLQINQFGWDAAFKWCGFSATAEYMLRIVDVRRGSFDNGPLAPWYLASGDNSTTAQHGAYLQVGYFLPFACLANKLELVARVGGVSALAERAEGSWEYAAGVNYYFEGNRVKLQADVTKVYEAPISAPYSSLANVNDDALVFRVQMSVAF